MNTGRLIGAVIGVWLVRFLLNGLFYTQVIGGYFEQLAADHPGMFREVVPGYAAADLVFAVFFVLLFTRVSAGLGGRVKAGVTLGLCVAFLSPVLCLMYQFFSVTYLPLATAFTDASFQIIAHALQGAVAGLIYKS